MKYLYKTLSVVIFFIFGILGLFEIKQIINTIFLPAKGVGDGAYKAGYTTGSIIILIIVYWLFKLAIKLWNKE